MNKRSYLLFLIPLCLLACNSNNKPASNETTSDMTDSTKASITEKSFGTYNNVPVTEYTLTNSSGIQVSILN